jgi:superfamily II DNA or RNA helicase
MELRPYQAQFVDDNPPKAILAWEMRVGKSMPAAIWIDRKEQAGNTFIITPKQNKKDWERMGTKAKVLTKEEFKKTEIVNPTAIVIDELHYFASALFIRRGKGRSQLSNTLYELVKKYPECHVLGLTATPIRQDAWSLHTLLCYIGVYYDWKVWQKEFFNLEFRPYLQHPAYFPKPDWRINIRPYLEKHCNIISMRDVVDDLPPLTPVFIKVEHKPYKKPIDVVVTWTNEHLYEQTGKVGEILKLGYRKLMVVAHYTAQIDELAEELIKEKPVFVLDGRTKDADKLKRDAQEADDCYFIVQSSMGFAFDGWMFGAIVFASMSHSCLNHTQMSGRLRHTEHLKPYNLYYLIGGRWDQRIYDTIEAGKDFNPHVYLNETPRSSKTK